MSLETEISELNATIKTLNENILLLLGSKQTTITTATPTPTIDQAEELPLIPAIATEEHTRDELQALCLDASRRNAANKDILKSIMLNNFNARKISDLADNQLSLCYNLIKEATHDA